MDLLNRSDPLVLSVLDAFTWSNKPFTCLNSLGSLENGRWLEKEENRDFVPIMTDDY